MPKQDASSNAEWKQWGEDDPFWGVASWAGRRRGGENPWTAEEFYALGKSDWHDLRKHLEAFGVPRHEAALEIGCGAGRLTKHIAQDYERVVGIDVSPGMLRTAREHLRETNIEFKLGNGLVLPLDDGSVDAVVSTHVFQHFDNLQIARRNFSEIARVLRPGGAMLVHLPMYHQHPSRLVTLLDPMLLAQRRIQDARARLRRMRKAPLMRRLDFSWTWLFDELPAAGLVDVELSVFRTRSNQSIHECVLARRLPAGLEPPAPDPG